eukprot:gene40094-48858_t
MQGKRGYMDRTQYEKLTRQIRYDFYAEVRAKVLEQHTDALLTGIFFGHHRGDVQENVLSNIMRGASPLSLNGMTPLSTTHSQAICRPLLAHDKQAIFDMAHAYGIPYFKDSTPAWSTRGQLRNELLPLLERIYGEGVKQKLTSLGEESEELKDTVERNIFVHLRSRVSYFPAGASMQVVGHGGVYGLWVWREVLKDLMHSLGLPLVREKAVLNFMERLERYPKKWQSGYVELRKGTHTFLTADGRLVVLKHNVLRPDLVVYNPATTFNQLAQRQACHALTAAHSSSREKREQRRRRRRDQKTQQTEGAAGDAAAVCEDLEGLGILEQGDKLGEEVVDGEGKEVEENTKVEEGSAENPTHAPALPASSSPPPVVVCVSFHPPQPDSMSPAPPSLALQTSPQDLLRVENAGSYVVLGGWRVAFKLLGIRKVGEPSPEVKAFTPTLPGDVLSGIFSCLLHIPFSSTIGTQLWPL